MCETRERKAVWLVLIDCFGAALSRINIPSMSKDISTQLLPPSSEKDDLIHASSGKSDTSYKSLAIALMKSLDLSGFSAVFSIRFSRVRKLVSRVGESMNTAPVGESMCTVSRRGLGASA